MRLLSFVLLVIVAVATYLFATENNDFITVHFYDWHWTTKLALLIGVIYFLGMFSGWFVVGMVRRSMERVVRR
jgi:uncharacterized membrane protein YciS (DUF1049 family)